MRKGKPKKREVFTMREQSFYMYNENEQGALARAEKDGTYTVIFPLPDGSVGEYHEKDREGALALMRLIGFIY